MLHLLAQVPGAPVSKWYEITAWSLIGAVLLAFLLTAWRDIFHIFFRAKDLGTGLSRIWAVARTAIFESWAGRIWIVPLLWLICVLVINALVIPYNDATDTISLYTSVCLYGQMFMVLVSLMVLAAFSCGRERERRTIITTGSKPISRLEFFLGKIVGFSTVGLMLLLCMGMVTYGYLLFAESHVRARAREKYDIAQRDYDAAQHFTTNSADSVAVPPPSQADLNVANTGVLMARNYIPAQQFQIAGLIRHSPTPELPDQRFLKTGEKMLLRFDTVRTRMNVPPTYVFRFPAWYLKPGALQNDPQAFGPPPDSLKEVDLRVVITPVNGMVQERHVDATLKMTQDAQYANVYEATFAPDIPALYVPDIDTVTQSPIDVEISCLTQGIYLLVMENSDPNDWNVVIAPDPSQDAKLPMHAPQILGTEKYDKQEIAGPSAGYLPNAGMINDAEVASFRFSYDDMQKVPKNASGNSLLSMYLDVDKIDNTNLQTTVDIEATDRLGQLKPVTIQNFPVNEKILTEVPLPLAQLPKGDDLYINIRCAVPGQYVSMVLDSVRFELPNSPFLLNLMKSELVLFFSTVLIITIAVVASIRVNGWVAMLVAVSAYFLGNAIPFLQDLLTSGIENLFSPGEMNKYKSSYFYSSLLFLQNISIKVVYVIARLLPDFRHFDPTTYILQYRNMPMLELCGDMLWMCLFAIPLIALGYLLIRKQELA